MKYKYETGEIQRERLVKCKSEATFCNALFFLKKSQGNSMFREKKFPEMLRMRYHACVYVTNIHVKFILKNLTGC